MRLQFDTVPAQDKLMDELVELGGFASKKDLFNNALTLLNWALNEAKQGRSIASINEEGGSYRELQMPALMHATRLSKNGSESFNKRKAVAA